MRALIYCRVSQDRAHGRSVEEQEAESRRLCDEREWTVTEVITDSVGASRHSKGKRAGWQRIIGLVEAGDVDVLVTWEASRAQRDLETYARLRDLCVRTGTLWCYSGRVHDLTTSDDRFRTGIDALVAEREADETAERIQRAMRSNAAKGRPHGRRLFGYQRTYDPATGVLTGQIPDEVEAPIVRRIFADYLAGAGAVTIARALNAEGITTGTGVEWRNSQVTRVLRNPAYVGKRLHQGEIIGDATWPPLVSTADWERVQARFEDPSRIKYAGTARLLTAVIRCGKCGGKMFVGHDRKTRKVYVCRAYHHVSRDEAKLDAYVAGSICHYLERDDIADLRAEVPEPEVDEARRRVADLRARLDEAVGQFTAGKLTGATLARIEGQLLPEIRAAETSLRRNVIPLTFDVPTIGVADWWEGLTPERRRELVNALLAAVVVHPTRRGARTFDPDAVELHWRRI